MYCLCNVYHGAEEPHDRRTRFKNVIECLYFIGYEQETADSSTRAEARSLLRNLTAFTTTVTAFVFWKFLKRLPQWHRICKQEDWTAYQPWQRSENFAKKYRRCRRNLKRYFKIHEVLQRRWTWRLRTLIWIWSIVSWKLIFHRNVAGQGRKCLAKMLETRLCFWVQKICTNEHSWKFVIDFEAICSCVLKIQRKFCKMFFLWSQKFFQSSKHNCKCFIRCSKKR